MLECLAGAEPESHYLRLTVALNVLVRGKSESVCNDRHVAGSDDIVAMGSMSGE